MSYQVIARKWRPQAFDEVTGQEHITRTLRNAIEHGRLHHAYLFSGARGVGKTTTARLFAKALNCHKSPGPNPTPCRFDDPEACPSCLEIAESRSIDVLEFDAASNTQVHKIREIIIENINIAPARDRYKVFIIDEVHMLSGSSFNALLKTVEEPPPNVVFIMATTELHKVPDTITSRCQEFVFRTISQAKIAERLRLIADAEGISVSPDALRMIARSGEGSMRDAQSNFDQVISYALGPIDVAEVSSALGLAESEAIYGVISSIAARSTRSVLETVAELVARGQDLRIFCRDLMSAFRDILMLKIAGEDESLVEGSALGKDSLLQFVNEFSQADLIRYFQILADTETRLKDSAQPRYVLEVGLVKLIEMARVKPIEEILAKLRELQAAPNDSVPSLQKNFDPKTSTSEQGVEKKNLNSGLDQSANIEKQSQEITVQPDIRPAKSNKSERPLAEPPNDLDSLIRNKEFIASLPVKLPPAAAEELDHIEDKTLDAAYEHKLLISGDNLLPVKNASAIVAAVVGRVSVQNAEAVSGPGGIAAVRAPVNIEIPRVEDQDISLPALPPNPTQEQILAYASAHPAVRRIARLFRAKILDVVTKQSSSD
ncbi:MAG: DNA polymerase III subunit gamma/tau [Pyrinomonadaceae bacterium]